MIRQLTDDDWKFYVESNKFGKFISSTPVNHDTAKEAEDEFSFSDAQTMVKVGLTDNETQNTIEVYFIFSNSGLENVIYDNKVMLEKSNDIQLNYIFPEAKYYNSAFYGMMDAKFGGIFSQRMLVKCERNEELARQLQRDIKSKILESKILYNNFESTPTNAIPSNNIEMNNLIKQTIASNLIDYMKQYDHISTYIELQMAFGELLIESYMKDFAHELDKEMQKEIEYARRRSEFKLYKNPNPPTSPQDEKN